VAGQPLNAKELIQLEMTLSLFKDAWQDEPIVEHVKEIMADGHETISSPLIRTQFIVVDYNAAAAAQSFQHHQYQFSSRRLCVAREYEAITATSSFRSTAPTTIDIETRELLARARVTMRIRTMVYVTNRMSKNSDYLVLLPTNTLLGYVV
jgi:hypothetical protein